MQQLPLSRRKFLTLSSAAAFAGFAPSVAFGADEPPKNQKDAAKAINGFAADLYAKLAGEKSKEKGNLFLSPFSIEVAFAMTAAGAKGKTLEEMEKVLHLSKDSHEGIGELIRRLRENPEDKKRPYELSIANALWAQQDYPWDKKFLEFTRKHYGAGMVEVDFKASEAARKQINDWVEKETKEKIKDLIPEGAIDGLTRMVLANAIYFKSNWLYQFDKKLTKDAPFTKDDGKKVDVPLMTQRGKFNYGEFTMFVLREGEKVQVLELPYAGKELSMLVFLPEAPDGVHRLARWLKLDRLSEPKVAEQDVKLFLPRFKAESEFKLKDVLMDMGMKLAFTSADLTGMAPPPRGKELYIAEAFHKAFVDVNEEGTEAAAATAVIVKGKSARPEPKEFRADRPFVFVIRDNVSGTVLFQGRYTGPNS